MSQIQHGLPATEMVSLYEEGKEALNKNDIKRAIKLFTKAIHAYSEERDTVNDLTVVYIGRSAAYFYGEKYNQSLLDAQTVIEKRPDWAKGYFRKGEALIELCMQEEALNSLQKAKGLETDPRSIDIINLRILRLEQEKRAVEEGLVFKHLRPGKEICLSSYNPIKKLIYGVARGMQNLVYLVGDRQTGECVIIDACWDVDGIMDWMRRLNLHPVGCIVTHNHFDHVGGHPPPPFNSFGISVQGVKLLLSKRSNIKVYVNEHDADAFQVETTIDPARIVATTDGMLLNLREDRVRLKFIHTPGHTPGSQCVLLNDRCLFTGDTLFYNTCGRTDLPGGCPRTLYHTLQHILAKMDPSLAVYPGHSYGNTMITSIKREKELGLLRPISLEEWLSKIGASSGSGSGCNHT